MRNTLAVLLLLPACTAPPVGAPQYADMHIGVVTSDYGAGDSAGSGCDASPGGQKGLLQVKGAAAPATCQAPNGASYIQYAFSATVDTCNLPGGCTPQSLGDTFTCMATVGSAGCGFEHQLESVYAALTNGQNAGFLREGALLAVVFVTNEDDGSAPSSVKIFEPSNSSAGAYTTYRQTHFGVACGTPPMLTPEGASMGALIDCEAAPNTGMSMIGQEWDISRYVDLFTTPAPKGIKADPFNEVILVGIDAPETPAQTILAATNTGGGKAPNPAYVPCSPIGQECVVALQHSCQNTPQPAFFGDPAVRLNEVINQVPLHQTASICGADLTQPPDYTEALQKVASLISSTLRPGCIPSPLSDVDHPDCAVQDVTTESDGTTQKTPIPSCASSPGTFPCWRVMMNAQCAPPASPQSLAVTIDRDGQTVPANTTARVECSTTACPASNPAC